MDIVEGTKYSRGKLIKINKQLKEEGKRYCSGCLKLKNWDDFHWANKKKGYKRSECIECQKEYDKKYYEENKERKKEYQKKWNEENKEHYNEYQKKWSEENKEYMREYGKKRDESPTKLKLFYNRLLPYYEGRIRRDKDGYVEVRCEYNGCQKWFKPTYKQLANRWSAICGKRGTGSEDNIYCSDLCKKNCGKYGNPWRFKNEDDLDKDGNNWVPYEWARRVKERDNRTCQECGKTEKDGIELHAHHRIPRGVCAMLEADVDNGITLCRECHHEKNCIEGCEYNYLAREDKEAVQKDTIAA